MGHRAMPRVHLLQRIGNLTDGCTSPNCIDRKRKKILGIAVRGRGERFQCFLTPVLLTLPAHPLQAFDLAVSNRRIIDIENLDLRVISGHILVDTDNHILTAVDACLPARRRFFDTSFRQA